jgi:single-strand DNA-binding protein
MFVTIAGNAVEDPQLSYTPNGDAKARFRVADDQAGYRNRDGTWVDKPVFKTVVAWRSLAENLAATVSKGTRVIGFGQLEQRSYETEAGERRTAEEVVLVDAGPSCKFATAEVTKAARGGATSRPGPATAATAPVADDDEPF